MQTKAGKGEHHVYRIIPQNQDLSPLKPRSHYVGVDAVSWYINKEDSWFTNRMASGTLDITLSNGMEKYQTALGTFELKGGSKIAPVFDRPVLLDRNYRGGGIGFNASLTAIKKDTVLASVLKNAANASLGIVAGMVDTAAVTGPTQLLTSAGSQLVQGVRNILSDQSEKHEPLFDFNGLNFNIRADKILGPEVYLLFHRGADLNDDELDVSVDGEMTLPTYKGNHLKDGTWLLLRIKRSSEYPNVRPWFSKRRDLKGKIQSLVDDALNNFISKESALEQFKYTESGDGTLLDKFGTLRSIILNDGVITEVQALAFITSLKNLIVNARKSIKEANKDIIVSSEKEMENLFTGKKLTDSLKSIVKEQINAIEYVRDSSQILDKDDIVSSLSANDLMKVAKEMPLTMEEIQNF
ncbi:hypothetical protein [Psychroserpens algicola]|uniref:Uncharacterized protein n=1 Tax=Psychroserpens algicola TaxID=1719034 RepID=A0ABT0H3V9_9FLAO|nr:hypothetical protein [Psychroserpens algicola]MCK8479033.1 hypothetical protein [Psychroserpens algicola]